MIATKLVCHGCGWTAPPLDPRPFRCPNSGDDVDHVLERVIALDDSMRAAFFDPEPNPFIRYRRLTHAWHTAMAIGMTDDEFIAIVRALPEFCVTPFVQHGNFWIKDETSNLTGSHKGRHLMGVMIWLEIAGRIDPALKTAPLAIASCGNAARAAAAIASAAGRTLDQFVPEDPRCARKPGMTGDPCYAALREAVAQGAVPFTCQGNENGLVIEGGQTLGWEMVSQHPNVERLFVQVGGGALASAVIAAFEEAYALGLIARMPRIYAVQTEASPLKRAWDRLSDLDYAIHHRSEFMWPWETTPVSVAHGILDDETYDWVAIVRGMQRTGGYPIVVSEKQLIDAQRLAVATTGIPVDATGAAGYAGALAIGLTGTVLFTGRLSSRA